MKAVVALGLAGLVLAGCADCEAPTDVNAGVGIGDSGVSTAVSVGKSCGPGYIAVGFGNGYYVGW